MRPISNVVDATNYAMLELGQPQHAFDLDLLAGHAIVVRRAADGERMVTLDDVERVFTSEDLMIADAEKSMGIAGVMGSAPAEVHAGTKDVLLESAYFQPRGVLLTARRLGLRTEASIRFERGVDPDMTADAAARCARFIAEWSGGRVLTGAIDVGTAPPRRRVAIRPSRTTHLLGAEVGAEEISESLGRLRMVVEPTDDGALSVEVPGYRPDIQGEVELIEEVARVRGYDSFGSTLPAIRTPGGLAPTHAFRRRVRDALLRAGLREVRSVAFATEGDLGMVGDKPEDAAKVANPIDADRPLLRTSLIPGLLAALQRNLARNVSGAALFEVGTRFRSGEPVDERELVALAMTGSTPPHWYEPEREGDVFDAKGALEALFGTLGITGWSLGGAAGAPFHPGRSAVVEVGEVPAGVIGELHPRVAAHLDFPDRVAVAELYVEILRANAAERVTYAEIPRYPPVHRDLAFVVDAATSAGAVRMAIREAVSDRALTASVALFDVFTGAPVPEGKKSLAFSVDLRTADRTLTDDEADAAVQAVVARLAQDFGAELRAG
jgi:phenylalanyl-tRNA synthetase beta chain